MNKEESRNIKKIILYSLSIIVAVIYLAVYFNDNLYEYVKQNITKSNVLPYALMIFIFLIISIAVQLIFTRVEIKSESFWNSRYGGILAWLLTAVFGFLLIKCYLAETKLFDAPDKSILIYHQNDRLSIMVLIGIFAMALYIISGFSTIAKERKYSVLIYIYALTLGLFMAYCLFTPNFYVSYYNVHHSNAYYSSVYTAMMGVPRDAMNGSVYGFYALLIAPFVKLLGGTYTSFCYVMCAVYLLCYMCIVYVINNLVKHDFIKVVSIASLMVITCSYQRSIYFQLVPHRIFFMGIITAYIVLTEKHNISEKISAQIAGYLLCVLAIVWNMETGIIYTIVYLSYMFIKSLKKYRFTEKKLYINFARLIIQIVATFLGAWLFVGIINALMGGSMLSLRTFMYPMVNNEYMSYLTADYQRKIVAWIFVAVTAFIYVFNGMWNSNLNKHYTVDIEQDKIDAIMFAVAVGALGQMTYYINRPAYGNLYIVYFTAIVMIGVLADRCSLQYNNFHNNAFLKNIYIGIGAIMLTVMIGMCMSGFMLYQATNEFRLEESYRDTSEIDGVIEQIGKDCHKDTKAMGMAIPMIYSDLGWDSGYYIIDFADLAVYPDSIKYISEELNYNINEPVLLDSVGIDAIKQYTDIDKFYERYTIEREYVMGRVTLYYFVPNE